MCVSSGMCKTSSCYTTIQVGNIKKKLSSVGNDVRRVLDATDGNPYVVMVDVILPLYPGTLARQGILKPLIK